MCRCKKKTLNEIRKLAQLYKKEVNEAIAIYILNDRYDFCEHECAVKYNYNIIEVI